MSMSFSTHCSGKTFMQDFDGSKISEDLGRITLRRNECINLILKTPCVEKWTELMWNVTHVRNFKQNFCFMKLKKFFFHK